MTAVAMGAICAGWLAAPALAQPDLSFSSPNLYNVGIFPGGIATADFNGDGRQDLAVSNWQSDTVSILLGNGDGTFEPQQPYAVGEGPYGVAVGDFNGDGKPDLAVADCTGSTVSILLGNGDGSFQPERQLYAGGSCAWSVTVGDFNRDGKEDLAVTNNFTNTVSILLGNGDGTFQPAASYPVGEAPEQVVVGDFNGDGKPDLAVADWSLGGISVLLGNGDGTFQPASTFANSQYTASLVVGEFNGDGRQDLAALSYSYYSGTVSVFLGNGDGTFQREETSYTTPGQPGSIALGDLNGDGRQDVVVAGADVSSSTPAGSASILLGDGDGTFQPAQSFDTGNYAGSPAVADFNGDGRPDLAIAGQSGTPDTVSVLLNSTVTLTSQTIAFPAAPVTYGQQDFSPASASSGLPVSYSDPAGQCRIDGEGLVQITGAGSCTLTASQPGNQSYRPATPVTQTFTILPATLLVNANDASTAYATSPVLGYSFSGFVNGETATSAAVSGSASCTATPPSQNAGTYPDAIHCAPGNLAAVNYQFATGASGTLRITPAPQTITFTSAPPSTPTIGGTYTVSASGGGSSNPVLFSVDASSTPGSCSTKGATVLFTGAGSCVIDANQEGAADYQAASQAQQTLAVRVSAAGIGALTLRYVEGSAAYRAASEPVRALLRGAVSLLSGVLAPVGPTTPPAVNTALIDFYKAGVAALRAGGLLSDAQAATLDAAASEL